MRKGISTIIATIILVVITIGLVSTAYLYFSGLIGGMTRGTISLVDAYCVDASDDIIVIVKNEGTAEINGLDWVINGQTATLGDDTCDDAIAVGSTATCNITNAVAGMNEIRAIGANPVGGSIQCR